MLFAPRYWLARRYEALLLVLSASLFRDFRRGARRAIGIAASLGSAAHAATSGNRRDNAGFSRACSADRDIDRQIVSSGCSHARCSKIIQNALVACAGLGGGGGFSFVNCMWITPVGNARISIIAINVLALGFIYGGRANHSLLVRRPRRGPPSLPGLHRRCRSALRRHQRDLADSDLRP